jgi:hypothetical protein
MKELNTHNWKVLHGMLTSTSWPTPERKKMKNADCSLEKPARVMG